MEFKCPNGSYISELKHFGFLYYKDKRVNHKSEASEICYEVEHPLSDFIQRHSELQKQKINEKEESNK